MQRNISLFKNILNVYIIIIYFVNYLEISTILYKKYFLIINCQLNLVSRKLPTKMQIIFSKIYFETKKFLKNTIPSETEFTHLFIEGKVINVHFTWSGYNCWWGTHYSAIIVQIHPEILISRRQNHKINTNEDLNYLHGISHWFQLSCSAALKRNMSRQK